MVGIKVIDAIVFRCHEYLIMSTAGDLHIGYVQRLSIDKPINWKRVQLPKSAGINVRWIKRGLVKICTSSHTAVLVRQYGSAFHCDRNICL